MSGEPDAKEDFLCQFLSLKKNPNMLSDQRIRKRKKSTIWAHYDEMSVPNRAKCVYCSLPISYSGGSSGNLKRHLRLKHPEVEEKGLKREDDDCFSKTMKIDDLEEIPEAEAAVFEITDTSPENDEIEEVTISPKESTPVKPASSNSNKNTVKRVILERSRTSAHVDPKPGRSEPRTLPQASISSGALKHEYDFFGEYVSSALKTLPPENAIAALAEIMEVISREKMSALVGVPSRK